MSDSLRADSLPADSFPADGLAADGCCLFDSHCHLDFASLEGDRDAVLARALEAGVRTILVPGVSAAQWTRAVALRRDARLLEGVEISFAVGLHPEVAPTDVEPALAAMPAFLDRLDAVAIGELGWDGRLDLSLGAQDPSAEAQLRMARERALPVILHVVGAHGHALERLAPHAPLRGVIHGYSGSAELVSRYVRLGLSIAIGPSVTDARATRVHEAVRAVPLERLLIETDAPDRSPRDGAPRRGEPADVRAVARAVAEVRGVSFEAVVDATRHNAEALFCAGPAEWETR